jgi:hypothetical protein
MTKQDLQKELLEKVKPGTKPSDIKKQKKQEKNIQKDQGYESDSSDKSIPKAPPLPNQNLLNQITSLKKQLQTYKDFKEADLKIKEKYKEQIKENQEKIKSLEGQIENYANETKRTNNC